jgi:hypothetical protein
VIVDDGEGADEGAVVLVVVADVGLGPVAFQGPGSAEFAGEAVDVEIAVIVAKGDGVVEYAVRAAFEDVGRLAPRRLLGDGIGLLRAG